MRWSPSAWASRADILRRCGFPGTSGVIRSRQSGTVRNLVYRDCAASEITRLPDYKITQWPYWISVPPLVPSGGASGAITTAAATRSPGSMFSSLTPWALRPDSRMVVESMRMILP